MAVFKIVNKPYLDPEDIYREIRYIYNPEKCIYKNSINLISADPYIIMNQFLYVKSFYGKQGGKQLEHFVLSLDTECEERDVEIRVLIILASFLLSEFQDYQMTCAIHNSSKNLHVHFIMNSVNMKNGKHFRLTRQEFNNFMYNIGELLSLEGIALKGYTYYDEEGRFRRGESDNPFLYPHKLPRYR